MKCAMSILLIISQHPLTLFFHLHLVHKINNYVLAVVLIQLDFENRLIQPRMFLDPTQVEI